MSTRCRTWTAGVKGLRIGILEEGVAEPIEPGVAEGALAAVSTLEKLGAEVTRISVPQHAQIDRLGRRAKTWS